MNYSMSRPFIDGLAAGSREGGWVAASAWGLPSKVTTRASWRTITQGLNRQKTTLNMSIRKQIRDEHPDKVVIYTVDNITSAVMLLLQIYNPTTVSFMNSRHLGGLPQMSSCVAFTMWWFIKPAGVEIPMQQVIITTVNAMQEKLLVTYM